MSGPSLAGLAAPIPLLHARTRASLAGKSALTVSVGTRGGLPSPRAGGVAGEGRSRPPFCARHRGTPPPPNGEGHTRLRRCLWAPRPVAAPRSPCVTLRVCFYLCGGELAPAGVLPWVKPQGRARASACFVFVASRIPPPTPFPASRPPAPEPPAAHGTPQRSTRAVLLNCMLFPRPSPCVCRRNSVAVWGAGVRDMVLRQIPARTPRLRPRRPVSLAPRPCWIHSPPVTVAKTTLTCLTAWTRARTCSGGSQGTTRTTTHTAH